MFIPYKVTLSLPYRMMSVPYRTASLPGTPTSIPYKTMTSLPQKVRTSLPYNSAMADRYLVPLLSVRVKPTTTLLTPNYNGGKKPISKFIQRQAPQYVPLALARKISKPRYNYSHNHYNTSPLQDQVQSQNTVPAPTLDQAQGPAPAQVPPQVPTPVPAPAPGNILQQLLNAPQALAAQGTRLD